MIRKLLLTLGLTALVSLPLHAQDSLAVVRKVNDLETQWGISLLAANWTAVESFLAPGFVTTGDDGKRVDRAGYLASLREGGTTYSNVADGPSTVLVSDGTAVHLGESTLTLKSKGGKVTHIRTVWTDTWVRQPNGMWLCIASQFVNQKVK